MLDTDLHEFIAHNPGPYASPDKIPTPVALEPGSGNHASVYRNLHNAILTDAQLSCDGVDGRKSLELANAIIYSGHTGQAVELPLDRQQYSDLLDELRTGHQ